MNPFFAWLIKSSLSLILLYSLFRITTRNDKNHNLNRFLLLGILVVSSVIPLLDFQFFYEEIPLKQVEVFREFVAPPIFTETVTGEIVQPVIETTTRTINPWLIIYLSIVSSLLVGLLMAILRVTQLISIAEKHHFNKIVLALVKDLIQPFTFLNKIVLSEKDFSENKDIIVAHEHAHIKHLHAIDLMVCEVFTVLHFFNPFMWLLRRDLKLIHEYQADQAVLNKGIDAKKYQLLVLQKSVGDRRFAMASNFTQKPILKRLKMMQKKNRKQWVALKLILFVPILILLLQAFAQPGLITKTEDFIPIKYSKTEVEKWFSKWTVENIGQGIFQPYGVKAGEYPSGSNNRLRITLQRNNRIYFNKQLVEKNNVKKYLVAYLNGQNPLGEVDPEMLESEIPFIGTFKASNLLIYFSYDKYLSSELINPILKSIGEAYLETKQGVSQKYFEEDYLQLIEDKKEIIDSAVPVKFSCSQMQVYKSKPVDIVLKGDGEIFAWGSEYSIEEFKNELIKEVERLKKVDKDGYKYSLHPNLKTDDGVSAKQVAELKNVFKNAKIQHVNYSSEKIGSELSIPAGFSPNGDGVHDFFKVSRIFPQYPNAKLKIFDGEGNKLFERENYGNSNVWNGNDAWWSGTSDNSDGKEKAGRLPAGNYVYVLELGNGGMNKGTVMLAK